MILFFITIHKCFYKLWRDKHKKFHAKRENNNLIVTMTLVQRLKY